MGMALDSSGTPFPVDVLAMVHCMGLSGVRINILYRIYTCLMSSLVSLYLPWHLTGTYIPAWLHMHAVNFGSVFSLPLGTAIFEGCAAGDGVELARISYESSAHRRGMAWLVLNFDNICLACSQHFSTVKDCSGTHLSTSWCMPTMASRFESLTPNCGVVWSACWSCAKCSQVL